METRLPLLKKQHKCQKKNQKEKLPAIRDVPPQKLLEKSAKVEKVVCKFKTYSITKTNELFYAGAVAVTNKLGVKINKAAEMKETIWEITK